jgi:uncharacterized protein YceK
MKYLLPMLALTCLLSGCASTQSETASSDKISHEPISTIPWNRPQKWEGQGAVGGMLGGN